MVKQIFVWILLVPATSLSAYASVCMLYPEPLKPEKRIILECDEATISNHHPQRASERLRNTPIILNFTCSEDIEPAVCAAAKATCARAGDILGQSIDIVEPIRVQVSFVPFCAAYGVCPDQDGTMLLGRASPAVTHLMVDPTDGNRVREYPQALLKQMQGLQVSPVYDGDDIFAMFNSEGNWYFDDATDQSIQPNQESFLLTVLHEYVHGLGFLTGYSNSMAESFQRIDANLPTFLTAKRYIPPNAYPQYVAAPNLFSPQGFWGFVEYAFDKHVWYKDHGNNNLARLSQLTDYTNLFYNANAVFATAIEFVIAWLRSPQAVNATYLAQLATTTSGTFFLSTESSDEKIMLYTESSRFLPGTTLSHFDTSTYRNSPDFLMISSAEMTGMTLQSIIEYNGGSSAFGPKLLQSLKAFGYKLKDDNSSTTVPQNLSIYRPPPDLVGTPDNPAPILAHADNGIIGS